MYLGRWLEVLATNTFGRIRTVQVIMVYCRFRGVMECFFPEIRWITVGGVFKVV